MSEEEIGRLADWVAIRELTARYNRAYDDGDVEAFISVFTEDGALDNPTEDWLVDGRAALANAVGTRPYGVVHTTTDATIDISGDRATQECTMVIFKRYEDRRPVEFLGTGRYHDTLIRTSAGWRFERRMIALDAARALMFARAD